MTDDRMVNPPIPEADEALRMVSKREQSSIQFPYGDLEGAVEMAVAVHEVGGHSCQAEQLAGYLKVAPTGGAFRNRIATPRIFGLLEIERGLIRLTQLGMGIVDPSQQAAAKVDAFLHVPLYRAIYEKYKGYTLPPTAALEREMAALGVSSKQTDKARQAFERSARQSGFTWAGADRLTLPVVRDVPQSRPVESVAVTNQPRVWAGGGGGGYHSFIQGLLDELPEDFAGWPINEQAEWLQAAVAAFKLLSKSPGTISIQVSAAPAKTAADLKRD
jgi:hypothetical protein